MRFLVLAAFLSGCDACLCGYGGPGCAPPALRGLCGEGLTAGDVRTVTIVYYDDVAGGHPATVTAARSIDTGNILVEQLDASTLQLTGLDAGRALIGVTINGWSAEQRFRLLVFNPSFDSGFAPDGGCLGPTYDVRGSADAG